MTSAPATAPPASLTKAAYDVFRTAAVSVSKRADLDGKHTAGELRLLRHTLNDFTQSVFLQVRANLLVPGVVEPIDPTLAHQATEAQAAFVAARIALQQEMDAVEALIAAEVAAPLAKVEASLNQPLEAAPPAKARTDAQRARAADHAAQTSALLTELTGSLPALLETASTQIDYLDQTSGGSGSGGGGGSGSVSAEVRQILTKLNADLTKKTTTAASRTKTAAAKQKELDAEGSASKTIKSPNSRLSARLAAKPY